MNSKKSLITVAIVIVVLLAGWFLWRGGFSWWGIGTVSVPTSPTERITPATQPGAGGQTTGGQAGEQTTGGQTGSIGKMTDDIYVEIMVQTIYQGTKDPTSWVSHGQADLFAKYGVTEENVKAYAEGFAKDPTRAQAIAKKYAQRLQELQATGK